MVCTLKILKPVTKYDNFAVNSYSFFFFSVYASAVSLNANLGNPAEYGRLAVIPRCFAIAF